VTKKTLSKYESPQNERGFIVLDKKNKKIYSSHSSTELMLTEKVIDKDKEDKIPKVKKNDFEKQDTLKRIQILEQKIYPELELIQKQVNRLSNLVIILCSIMAVVFGTYLINKSFSDSSYGISSTNNSELIVPRSVAKDSGKIIIDKFFGNNAINETGSKINVTQTIASTFNQSNCQTPIIPPENNGCGFVLIPNLLGLPKKGVSYTSLQIYGKINGDSQILIHQKNYQKGVLEKQIAALQSNSLEQKILLPEDLNNSNGLYFRLWDKGGEVSISSIVLNFSNIDDLSPVSGRLVANKNLYSKKAAIYMDVNDDGIFEPDTDKIWNVKNNFPGVKPIIFDNEGNFKIFRDETSFNQERPDDWKTDNFEKSLPPGKWLLVFEDNGQAASFEIQSKADQIQLDLKI
jgi:hypothetical protein